MDVYQFIKYNHETTIGHILKYNETGAVLCFDFEDSIYDWINPENSTQLKEYYRKSFLSLYSIIAAHSQKINIGVRLNNENSELQSDLKCLTNRYVHSIIIPKTESKEHLLAIDELLIRWNIQYYELIPVIESKQGLENLSEIGSILPKKIKRIGFGHCDYNADIGAFPFFHQYSEEYWKWIDRISEISLPKGLIFLNSAFLHLKHDAFFHTILSRVQKTFNNYYGQFTLTTRQTEICNQFEFSKNYVNGTNHVHTRLDLKPDRHSALKLVQQYEDGNSNRGFTITKNDRILISPQEYLAAKLFLLNSGKTSVHFTFVGGCFPVQHNVLFEDLFHQFLKRKIETAQNILFAINIIRYERFSTCLDKIVAYEKNNPIDILLFHIRPEPYLRLVKFYYKYQDYIGRKRWSLNLPIFRLINPEKYDMLEINRRYTFNHKIRYGILHKFLVDMNYCLGFLFGNNKSALKMYLQLIQNIIRYCDERKIRIYILGPAERRNSYLEPLLCRTLHSYLKKENFTYRKTLIDGFVDQRNSDKPYFHKNGIHATERYHQIIAKRFYEKMNKEIEKILSHDNSTIN
jgi:hypothetical protein